MWMKASRTTHRPWCCGNSGVALITLIGGLGVENIIGFDWTDTSDTIHQRIGHRQTSELSGAFNVHLGFYIKQMPCLVPPPLRPRQHFQVSSNTTSKHIDSEMKKRKVRIFQAGKITCLLIQTRSCKISVKPKKWHRENDQQILGKQAELKAWCCSYNHRLYE